MSGWQGASEHLSVSFAAGSLEEETVWQEGKHRRPSETQLYKDQKLSSLLVYENI